MAKNNKVSKKAPNKSASKKPNNVHVGSTWQTRDEYLSSGRGKKDIKPDHPSPTDLYRTIGVVRVNRKNQAVVVKLTKNGWFLLEDYGNGQSMFKAYLEIKDAEGKPIVVGKKFKLNGIERDLSMQNVQKIEERCLTHPQTPKKLKTRNRNLIKQFNKQK